jgi:hypothetical protein
MEASRLRLRMAECAIYHVTRIEKQTMFVYFEGEKLLADQVKSHHRRRDTS